MEDVSKHSKILFLFLNLNIFLGIELQKGLPTFAKISGKE